MNDAVFSLAPKSALREFLRRVKDRGGCWEWIGHCHAHGHGRFSLNGKQLQAHRVAWEWSRGPIAAGLQIDHLCRNRPCVNPAHLEPVTPRENTRRGESLQAKNARKTHCLNGHLLSGENVDPTVLERYRQRKCVACSRSNAKGAWATRKAAVTPRGEVPA